jgi:hypothetical protein
MRAVGFFVDERPRIFLQYDSIFAASHANSMPAGMIVLAQSLARTR